jgi:hypothetical protein
VSDGVFDHPLDLLALRDIGAKGERLSSLSFDGGDKRAQDEDIEAAKTYWQAYQKEHHSADY